MYSFENHALLFVNLMVKCCGTNFQAFILPMSKSAVIKEVLVVYHNWLKVSSSNTFA